MRQSLSGWRADCRFIVISRNDLRKALNKFVSGKSIIFYDVLADMGHDVTDNPIIVVQR